MANQVDILGARIDSVTLDEAAGTLQSFIRAGTGHQVITVNLDFLRLAHDSEEFRSIINGSALAVADGMPLVWASHWLGHPLPQRVTGVALTDCVCALAAREGYRVFLLGGAEGVPEAAAAVLQARYPGLVIAGTYAPPMGPFSPDEDQKIVALIQVASPDVLLVAFGAPRQDAWIAEHSGVLQVPVAVGVGGVFNFLTGRVRRAPVWMQDKGLEWFYRLLQEPRRLWRRYVLLDLPVMLLVLGQVLATRLHGAGRAALPGAPRPLPGVRPAVGGLGRPRAVPVRQTEAQR